MKKVIVLFALSSLPLVVAQAQNDSIRSESLPEVVVTADGLIEMPDKAVLLPTSLEKSTPTIIDLSLGDQQNR